MIAFLMSIVGKLIGHPVVLAGVIGVAVFGVREFQHWREVRGLEQQIVELTQQRDAETRAKLEITAALSDITANRDALQNRIREQNDAITALQQARTAEQRVAALAAVRALQKGREEAAALRAPESTVPPGHAALNAWLCTRLGAACEPTQ